MKTNWKPGTLLAPVPVVMVSTGTMEKSNIITVGWTGIVCSEPAKTYVSIRPERYSYDQIRDEGAFVINMVTRPLAEICDYCGMVTGRKVDKFAHCGLTKEASETIVTPRIAESPLALECKVTDCIHLGTHDMFLADITNVALDDSLLDDDGRLDIGRGDFICYGHGAYYGLGKALGRFGYSMADKKKGKSATTKNGGRK